MILLIYHKNKTKI